MMIASTGSYRRSAYHRKDALPEFISGLKRESIGHPESNQGDWEVFKHPLS